MAVMTRLQSAYAIWSMLLSKLHHFQLITFTINNKRINNIIMRFKRVAVREKERAGILKWTIAWAWLLCCLAHGKFFCSQEAIVMWFQCGAYSYSLVLLCTCLLEFSRKQLGGKWTFWGICIYMHAMKNAETSDSASEQTFYKMC